MKKRKLWILLMLLCLGMAACGGGAKEGDGAETETDIYKPYPLDDTDTALMGAMDRAHAEFGGHSSDAALQQLEATFMELNLEKDKKIVVREANGTMRTFYIAAEMPESAWKPLEDPAKQGNKIKLNWRTAERPDDKGGKMTIEEAVSIEN